MDIAAVNRFSCSVAEAFEMLTDPEFLDRVAAASNPLRYGVSVDGLTATTTRIMASVSPIDKFTGPEIELTDQIAWDPPAGDERTGTAQVAPTDLPLSLVGRVTLRADGAESLLEYTGELTVSIPVVGHKLEALAAPLLLKGIEYQQQVADEWLAEREGGPGGTSSQDPGTSPG
ncbi:MAG: DUF2505 domain-containing protein [Propionibacteriaceae bacterium]|jgi:hypothetical protein|nr:DUF2505 domain-containing protein [Propionibacteriaceae bacterium]